MLLAVTDAIWAVLVVVAYVVLALFATVVAVGLPAAIGKLIYDRARDEDLANPAVLGFGAAFFALLLGVFVVGVGLLYVG